MNDPMVAQLVNRILSLDVAKISRIVDALDLLDLKKPELMGSVEKTTYTARAMANASFGQVVTVKAGETYTMPPGRYYNLTQTLNHLNGGTWVIPVGTTIGNEAPLLVTNPNGVDATMLYQPGSNKIRVPLFRTVVEAGGLLTFLIQFTCDWAIIETTAAGGFVQALSGHGPLLRAWNAAAGNTATISLNAYL